MSVGKYEPCGFPTPHPWQSLEDDFYPPAEKVDEVDNKREAPEENEGSRATKKARESKAVQETVQSRNVFGNTSNLREDVERYKSRLSAEDVQKIGMTIASDTFATIVDRQDDKNFPPGELVIAKRTGDIYQYALVILLKENKIVFYDGGAQLNTKSPTFFYHLKVPEISTEDLAYDQQQAENLGKRGVRSMLARHFTAKLKCSIDFGTYLLINEKKYEVITGGTQGFSTKLLASCGSTPFREIILFDPDKSPTLMRHFHILQSEMIDFQSRFGPLTNEQVLFRTMKYTMKNVFNKKAPSLSVESDTQIFIKSASDDSGRQKTSHFDYEGVEIPIFFIEEFVAAGKGSCTQRSMFLCIMLHLLTRYPDGKPILDGVIQSMRDNMSTAAFQGSAHNWTTFIPKAKPGEAAQKWHIDANWEILQNFANENGRRALAFYGDSVATEIKRTAAAARQCGQPED